MHEMSNPLEPDEFADMWKDWFYIQLPKFMFTSINLKQLPAFILKLNALTLNKK